MASYAVPGVPGSITAKVQDAAPNMHLVEWMPPSQTGGQPITDYDIQSCNFYFDCSSENSWIDRDIGVTTVATGHYLDLWGGISLVFVRVRAVNSVGPGPWSAAVTPTKQNGDPLDNYPPDASFYIPGGHSHCYDQAPVIDASNSRDKDTNQPVTFEWYQNKADKDADYVILDGVEVTPTPGANNNSEPSKVYKIPQTGSSLTVNVPDPKTIPGTLQDTGLGYKHFFGFEIQFKVTDSGGKSTWSVPIPVDIIGSDWTNCPNPQESPSSPGSNTQESDAPPPGGNPGSVDSPPPSGNQQSVSCSPPTAATNLSLTATNNSITATWDAATCAPQGYQVRYREVGNGGLSSGDYVSGLSQTLTGLGSGKSYVVRVDTLNEAGTEAYSGTRLVGRIDTTSGGGGGEGQSESGDTPEENESCSEPTKASDLTLTPGSGRLTASWTAASCAPEGYLLRWRERSAGSSLNNGLKVEGAATLTITGLTNGTEYVVRVDTMKADGSGAQRGTALAERGTPGS